MSGFDDPFWTPQQVVAWVAFKDRGMVAATDAVALRKLWYTDQNGRKQKMRDALAEYISHLDPKGDIRLKYSSARVAIQTALKKGDIVAWYIPEGSNQRVEASKIHWIDNDFLASAPAGAKGYFNEQPHLYDTRFEAEKIRQKWPATRTHAEEKSLIARAAYDALYEMMEASLERRPKPKAEILADLIEKTPGLTKRTAESQWIRAAEDTGAHAWRMPGRPANDDS